MSTFLYRLGRGAYRHRRAVTALWILLLALLGIGAGTLTTHTSNSFSIPGVEAQHAIDLLKTKFPAASANGANAQVVFVAPTGQTLDATDQQAITATVTALGKLDGVQSATDPYQVGSVSADHRIALANAAYTAQPSEITAAQKSAVQQAVQPARDAGLEVVIGGSIAQQTEAGGSTEGIGVLVGAVVLAITFGSIVAAGLPLLTALLGVGIGLTGLLVVGHWVELSSTAPVLALMLGLAVGIDYALFIISRFRHQLIAGDDPEQAVATATATAGSAVVFAGLTVLIALAGLTVVGIPFLSVMGLAAAATVLIAVLVALTLLPALLGFAGRKIIGTRIPGTRRPDYDDDDHPEKPTMGRRWIGTVLRHRWIAVIVPVLALGLIALPVTGLRTGLPDNGTAAPASAARQAYDLVAEGFGPGVNGPLTVVVTGPGASAATTATSVAAQIRSLPDVASVGQPIPNPAGDTALLSVIPKSGPSSAATTDLVHAIRDLGPDVRTASGDQLYVTGQTALQIDVSARLSSALPMYLLLVVGLALILLLIVFRSILVPIKAALGFLLTIGATFGAMVAVFQWGWLKDLFGVSQEGPIVSFLPIIVIAILFGLAMDYEVFLVSRMHEEFAHGAEPDEAVTEGFRHGARVVTAAAIIMTSVFAGFILGDDAIVKSIGFALSLGVLIDAFIIRMTVVPAVLSLLGRSAWWLPRWLSRIVPTINIEGEDVGHRGDPATDTATDTATDLESALAPPELVSR